MNLDLTKSSKSYLSILEGFKKVIDIQRNNIAVIRSLKSQQFEGLIVDHKARRVLSDYPGALLVETKLCDHNINHTGHPGTPEILKTVE